jgi:nephrocystin-3
MAKVDEKSRIKDSASLLNKSWRTVRVFVSSTFRDMQAERDYLAKVVFPELRDRMSKRNLHLVDLDLRWGVTEEEAEQGKVLDVILGEIDRSRPFFVGLLGERYGALPDKIPEDTKRVYPWLKDYEGYSFTSLEIVYGVLRNPELTKHACFYFRDPELTKQIPELRRIDYVAENQHSESQLANLKNKIRCTCSQIMENYPCRWDEQNSKVVDLEIFGQKVLEDLWNAICEEYPNEAPESDPVVVERQMHEAFVEERSFLHVGRIDQARLLTHYVQGNDPRPIVITGESGCGKSAFLANWYRQYTAEHPDDFVLAYFLGASPDSTNHFRLLLNMCQELKRNFSITEEINEDNEKISQTLSSLLSHVSNLPSRFNQIENSQKNEKSFKLIVLLDGLDQLQPLKATFGLGWILDFVPIAVHLVLSSAEGEYLDVLRRRGVEEIKLPRLNKDEQLQIIHNMLEEWGRKLDEKQSEALFAIDELKNPLYLRVALEELRLFGSFQHLTLKITKLEPTIPGLFKQVLERLEEDNGSHLVSELFMFLGCSRYGLSEAELLDLMCRKIGKPLPRALWARLIRSAKMYLTQKSELLSISQQQFAEVVTSRYLNQGSRHKELVSFFKNATLERKLDEYPFQLMKAGESKALAETLSDLNFFDHEISDIRIYEWTSYWQSMQDNFDPSSCYLTAVNAEEKKFGKTEKVALHLNNIALFLSNMGMYKHVLSLFERSLEIREQALGPNHLDVAASLNNIGVFYNDQGKYKEALVRIERSLNIRERTLDQYNIKLAGSIFNLARIYFAQSKFEEALMLLKRCKAIMERTYGSKHSDTAAVLLWIAIIYQCQARYSEALSMNQEVLVIFERTLGPNHPGVATVLEKLATLYKIKGNFAEALSLNQRALEIQKKVFGINHNQFAFCLMSIAEIYFAQGRYSEALALYQQSQLILEKTFGSPSPYVAETLNAIARVYHSQGKYNEALAFYKQSLRMFEHISGKHSAIFASGLMCIGAMFTDQGKYNDALKLYKQSLKIEELTLGPNHPLVAVCLGNIGNVYFAKRNYVEALKIYKRSLVNLEKALGPNNPEVAACLDQLAGVLSAQGKYGDAESLYRKSLEIQEQIFGLNHLDVAVSLFGLAETLRVQARYDEALPLFERSVEISERVLGSNHPLTIQYKEKLNSLHR